jgi:antitoxin component of MazEF toxin-antitoxin module
VPAAPPLLVFLANRLRQAHPGISIYSYTLLIAEDEMSKLARWGNSIGLRLPQNIVECAGLSEGSEVICRILDSGDILVRAVEPRPQASLEDQNGSKPQVPPRATAEKW